MAKIFSSIVLGEIRSITLFLPPPQEQDQTVCDWCGAETRLTWRDGAGYCRACHRELCQEDARG